VAQRGVGFSASKNAAIARFRSSFSRELEHRGESTAHDDRRELVRIEVGKPGSAVEQREQVGRAAG
jgi:hypothetical protein